mmetsp:Transcript_164196/g.399055  ORF Transcript_164196/g.399055 Transcript_164196/m.399055 type:complete len:553 (-) Transcript_164196:68-1726(-)
MSAFSYGQFTGVFKNQLAEVERCALNEVRQLHEALERLRAENQLLRRQVAQPSPEWGDGKMHEHHLHDLNGQHDWERDCPNRREDARTEGPESFKALEPWNIKKSALEQPSSNDTASGRSVSLRYHRDTVQTRYKRSGTPQRVVRSAAFEYATFGLVIFNTLWMAIDLDFNGKPLLESSAVFQAAEHFFVTMFSLELVVRFLAFERKRIAFSDRWFLLDSSIVILMILDSWVLTIAIVVTGNSNLGGMNIISTLRILRVLRIARMMKICRFMPELETMMSSMLTGIRAVLTAGMIMLAMTYGFAIALRSQSTSTAWGHEHFPSVPHSVYTLLVESMLPDNGELLTLIGRDSWLCGIIYGVFLLLSAITVLNMLVGMLVDVISRVSTEETEQRNIEAMGKALQSMLRSADKDYDGLVSKAEFESIVANPEAVSFLYRVGVDVQTLAGEAEVIFGTQGTSRLPFEEFKEEVLQFRRTQTATLGTIMATRRRLHMTLEQFAGRLEVLESLAHKSSIGHLGLVTCPPEKLLTEAPAPQVLDCEPQCRSARHDKASL